MTTELKNFLQNQFPFEATTVHIIELKEFPTPTNFIIFLIRNLYKIKISYWKLLK